MNNRHHRSRNDRRRVVNAAERDAYGCLVRHLQANSSSSTSTDAGRARMVDFRARTTQESVRLPNLDDVLDPRD